MPSMIHLHSMLILTGPNALHHSARAERLQRQRQDRFRAAVDYRFAAHALPEKQGMIGKPRKEPKPMNINPTIARNRATQNISAMACAPLAMANSALKRTPLLIDFLSSLAMHFSLATTPNCAGCAWIPMEQAYEPLHATRKHRSPRPSGARSAKARQGDFRRAQERRSLPLLGDQSRREGRRTPTIAKA